MEYSRDLFGTRLKIVIDSQVERDVIETCFKEAEQFEKTYSRFIK